MEKNQDRVCENCKYTDYGLYDIPCRDCFIPDKNNPDPKDNNKWEPNDENN